MVVIQDLDEIQATIIPRFVEETGCHFVTFLPFYGATIDNVARQATRFTNRLRGISTTATGIGFGEAVERRPCHRPIAGLSIGTRPLSR
jgi:hypothetical protein